MPTRLQLAFRMNDSNIPRAVEMLRLLRAPPIAADAVVLVWDGFSLLLGLSLDFDGLSEWVPEVSHAATALTAAFDDVGLAAERVDPLPTVIATHFSTLGGSHVP